MIYTPVLLLQLGVGRGRLIGRWAGLPVRAGTGVHVCVCAGGPVGGAGSPAGGFSVSRAADTQSGPRNKAFLNKRLACSPPAGAPTPQRNRLMRGQMLRLEAVVLPSARAPAQR